MKTETQWKASEQELILLKKRRNKLKFDISETSKRIHILSTSINQYKKRRELK